MIEFNMVLDPTKHFENVSNGRIVQALGILPSWVDPTDERPMLEQFNEKYQFPLFPMSEGNVDERGIYYFPGDPPMYPLAHTRVRNEDVFFYTNSVVAIRYDDGSHISIRMD